VLLKTSQQKYREAIMTAMKHTVIGLTLLFSSFGFTSMALPADNGLITEQSRYSVKETVERFEAAVKAKESLGFMVFTELDHAAAAKKFGLEMRPRTVIVYGNPKFGTPVMVKTPLLAIDVPPKALVWEDDQGKVWLTYNSAEYLGKVIYARHGLANPPSTPKLAAALKSFADYATK
jgi:uncharacterized protein (DUF302 family)